MADNKTMDGAESKVEIKQEYDSEEICSSKFLIVKVEPPEPKNEEDCSPNLRIPKVEDTSENEMDTGEAECAEDVENFYEFLFVGKEEVVEGKGNDKGEMKYEEDGEAYSDDSHDSDSYDSEFLDEKFDVDSTPSGEGWDSNITNTAGQSETATNENHQILLCPFCGMEFLTKPTWRHHLNDIHEFNKRDSLGMELLDDDAAKCKECQKKLNSRKLEFLQQHKIRHLPYHLYVKCKMCARKYASITTFIKHLSRNYHKYAEYEKNVASAGDPSLSKLMFLCPFCGIESPNSYKWRQHLNSIHGFNNRENLNMEFLGNNEAECKECHEKVMSFPIWRLQLHKIRHLPFYQYVKCIICDQRFTNPYGHKLHIKRVHNFDEKKYIKNMVWQTSATFLCHFCGIEFDNTGDWRKHLNEVHEFKKRETLNMDFLEDNTIICKQCGKKLNNRKVTRLQWHTVTHLPYPQHVKCKICGQLSTNGDNHKKHFERLHAETVVAEKSGNIQKNTTWPANATFICPYCETEFPDMSVWEQHLGDVHEFNKLQNLNIDFLGANEAQCKQCREIIKSQQILDLQQHKITHLEQRFVKCTICAKTFHSVKGFITHLKKCHKRHNGICSETETSTQHMILLCPFCGTEFPKPDWRKHLNTVHTFFKRKSLNMDILTDNTAKCNQCQKIIKNQEIWDLQKHQITHLPYSQYVICKICTKKWSSVSTYKTHFKKKHSNGV